jgi:hypothetical protein
VRPTRGRASWWVAGGAAALASIPQLYALLRLGDRGIFNYFRADAFLYLTIAKRSSPTWYTFDGETATNGFHPLWGFLLTALHVLIGDDKQQFLVAAFLLSVAMTSIGVALTSVAIYRYTKSIFLSFFTVPGIYYLALGVAYENWPIWSGSSGLESAVSILSGGLLLFVLSRNVCREGFTLGSMYDGSFRGIAWRLGLVLPLVVLSRLDDVFVVACLFLVFLLTPGVPLRDKIRPAFNVVFASTFVVALYLAYNKAYAGSFMPISGSVKSRFTLFQSLYVGLSNAFPFLMDLKESATGRASIPRDFSANAFRFVQIVGPAVMAVIYVWATAVHHRRDPRFILPAGLALGVLVKILYNLGFVHLWDQGSWYYALPVLMTSFFFCILAGDAYARLDARGVGKRALIIAYAVALTFASGREILRSAYIDKSTEHDFWDDRVAVQKALDRVDSSAKLLELGDGIISFSLDSPSIHGFGFSGDKQSVAALQDGRLLAHAYERGHRILASQYVLFDDQVRSSEQIKGRLRQSGAVQPELRSELHSFDFELLFAHVATGIGFVRFEPRPQVSANPSE